MATTYSITVEIRLTGPLTDVQVVEMTKAVLEAVSRLVEEGELQSGEGVMTEQLESTGREGQRVIAHAGQVFWVPPTTDNLKRGSGRTD